MITLILILFPILSYCTQWTQRIFVRIGLFTLGYIWITVKKPKVVNKVSLTDVLVLMTYFV